MGGKDYRNKYMNKLVSYIFNHFMRKGSKSETLRITKMLTSLNPGTKGEQLYRNYCEQKIKKIILVIIASIVLIVALVIQDLTHKVVDDSGRLVRGDVNGIKYEANLVANVDKSDIDISVEVPTQKLTKVEADILSEEIWEKIKNVIWGNNVAKDHVTEAMNLVTSIAGYPFSIRWESSDYKVLQDNGKIGQDISIEGSKVDLKCIMTYEEYKYEKNIEVNVFPKEKSDLEKTKDEIIASIQMKQLETQNKEYLQLPMFVGKKGISWKKAPSSTGPIVAVLCIVAIMSIWWGVDNDLTKQYRKRDQLLRADYSEFVSKLQLLISSGMTLRGALERMEADYKKTLNNGGKTKYVYEELCICMKRMRDGTSETEVYTMFGNRCGQMSYKKLMTFLTQNLKKGTAGLMEALDFEAKVAFEERKHLARRAGEEAQTKLLFPMMMMLGVVMVIILVPAYFSFVV